MLRRWPLNFIIIIIIIIYLFFFWGGGGGGGLSLSNLVRFFLFRSQSFGRDTE